MFTSLEHLYPRNQQPSFVYRTPETSNPFRKIIAKVRSGVRFGVGFVLERACGDECNTCSGSAFHRKCRYFEFLPHHQVRLEKKVTVPSIKVHLLVNREISPSDTVVNRVQEILTMVSARISSICLYL